MFEAGIPKGGSKCRSRRHVPITRVSFTCISTLALNHIQGRYRRWFSTPRQVSSLKYDEMQCFGGVWVSKSGAQRHRTSHRQQPPNVRPTNVIMFATTTDDFGIRAHRYLHMGAQGSGRSGIYITSSKSAFSIAITNIPHRLPL